MLPFSSALFVSGAHIDLIGRLDAPPVMAASNPGRVTARPGGAGLNMASNAAAFGLASTLAGPVGKDENAGRLKRVLTERGVGDALAPLAGHPTGTYTAVVAPDGQMVIGLADLSIYEATGADWLLSRFAAAFKESGLWCLLANLDGQVLADISGRAREKQLAGATISPAKAVRLTPMLERLDLLFTNLAEARSLTGMVTAGGERLVRALINKGVGAGTLSAGAGPLLAWEGEAIFTLQPPPMAGIADVNGAGDALAAAVMAGLSQGLDVTECARLGIAAAQWTLASPEPFRAGLGWDELLERAKAIEPARRLG